MWKYSDKNIGEFVEKEHGCCFTYEQIDHNNEWAIKHGFTYQIYTICGYRAANIKKTVAYVCVDEADDGSPIVEKWFIKNHIVYKNNSQFDEESKI